MSFAGCDLVRALALSSIMRIAAISILLVAGACTSQNPDGVDNQSAQNISANAASNAIAGWLGGAADEQLLDRLEAQLTMPEGASALHQYSRAYAWTGNGKKVVGVFLSGNDRRYWTRESELPKVLDGGCGLVTITYDVGADRIESAVCNGVA